MRRVLLLLSLTWASVPLLIACEPQSEMCARFIECQPHYEEEMGLPEEQLNRYQTEGICWENADLAATCHDECVAGLLNHQSELAVRNLPLGACTITAEEAGIDEEPDDDDTVEDAGTVDGGGA